MTTTAHEDQFTIGTQTIEPVRQPYNTVSILRRNIADMEVALRTQTERAEAAEAELAKLAQQSPIKYLYRVIDCFGHDVLRDDPKGATILETVPLFAAPAPAVPAEWRAVMVELLANDGADGGRYDANKWLAARDKARALLQSSAQAPAVPAEIMALSKKYTIDTKAYHAAMDALLQSAGATK